MEKFQVDVTVLPKGGVLDVQGKAVERAFASGGYSGVSDIRVGKFVRFVVEAADEAEAGSRASELAEAFLANDVVESYTFELERIS